MEKNGMVTGIWGKVGWIYLHSVAHGYPVNPEDFDQEKGYIIGTTRSNYHNFFILIGDTLPCKFCRDSYKKFIAENPIRLNSRLELTKWLWEIHNMVNKKLGKKYNSTDVSFENIYNKYESYRAACPPKDSHGCINPLGNIPKKKCTIIIENASISKCKLCTILVLVLLSCIVLCHIYHNNTR